MKIGTGGPSLVQSVNNGKVIVRQTKVDGSETSIEPSKNGVLEKHLEILSKLKGADGQIIKNLLSRYNIDTILNTDGLNKQDNFTAAKNAFNALMGLNETECKDATIFAPAFDQFVTTYSKCIDEREDQKRAIQTKTDKLIESLNELRGIFLNEIEKEPNRKKRIDLKKNLSSVNTSLNIILKQINTTNIEGKCKELSEIIDDFSLLPPEKKGRAQELVKELQDCSDIPKQLQTAREAFKPLSADLYVVLKLLRKNANSQPQPNCTFRTLYDTSKLHTDFERKERDGVIFNNNDGFRLGDARTDNDKDDTAFTSFFKLSAGINADGTVDSTAAISDSSQKLLRILENEEKKEAAAIKILALMRGKIDRKKFKELKQDKQQEKQNQNEQEAAPTIQQSFRMHLARKQLNKLKLAKKSNAAIMLQCALRSHNSRQAFEGLLDKSILGLTISNNIAFSSGTLKEGPVQKENVSGSSGAGTIAKMSSTALGTLRSDARGGRTAMSGFSVIPHPPTRELPPVKNPPRRKHLSSPNHGSNGALPATGVKPHGAVGDAHRLGGTVFPTFESDGALRGTVVNPYGAVDALRAAGDESGVLEVGLDAVQVDKLVDALSAKNGESNGSYDTLSAAIEMSQLVHASIASDDESDESDDSSHEGRFVRGSRRSRLKDPSSGPSLELSCRRGGGT